MNKILLYIFFTLIGFFSIEQSFCISEKKATSFEKNQNPIYTLNLPDSIMCNNLQIRKINPQIHYDANAQKKIYNILTGNDSIVFTMDEIAENFTMTVFHKSGNTSTYKTLMEQKQISNLNVDYRESNYYTIDSRIYLIVSHPMGWTGLKTNYRFYQLLFCKEKTVYEFISFGDNPCVLRKTENGFDIIRKEGEYNPECGEWKITEIIDKK